MQDRYVSDGPYVLAVVTYKTVADWEIGGANGWWSFTHEFTSKHRTDDRVNTSVRNYGVASVNGSRLF
jgi:hypothetical protein